MTIIEKNGTNGFRDIQSQSHRSAVWLQGYIEVPEHLTARALGTRGFCDIEIAHDVLVGITPTAPPGEPPMPEPTPEEMNAQAIAELSMSYAEEMAQAQTAIMELSMLIGGIIS